MSTHFPFSNQHLIHFFNLLIPNQNFNILNSSFFEQIPFIFLVSLIIRGDQENFYVFSVNYYDFKYLNWQVHHLDSYYYTSIFAVIESLQSLMHWLECRSILWRPTWWRSPLGLAIILSIYYILLFVRIRTSAVIFPFSIGFLHLLNPYPMFKPIKDGYLWTLFAHSIFYFVALSNFLWRGKLSWLGGEG